MRLVCFKKLTLHNNDSPNAGRGEALLNELSAGSISGHEALLNKLSVDSISGLCHFVMTFCHLNDKMAEDLAENRGYET